MDPSNLAMVSRNPEADPRPVAHPQTALPVTTSIQVENQTIQGNVYATQGDSHFNTTHIIQTITPAPSASLESRKSALVSQMPTSNFRAYHSIICGKRVQGTGKIFTEGDTLKHWLETKLGRLWCMGGPGVGKTYLASALIDLLQALARDNPRLAVAFAYLQFSSQLSTWDVVAALVRQLVERTTNEAVVTVVEKVFAEHRHGDSRPPLPQMTKLLQDVVRLCDDPVISFDGLDELLPDCQQEVLEIAMSLEAKVVIFSRHLPLLKNWLDRQKDTRPTTYLDIEASSEDIKTYINHRIDKTPGFAEILEKGNIKQKVATTVVQKSGGMFLHVALHLEVLRRCTSVKAILEEMERFPTDIRDLYANIMERIDKEPEQRRNVAKRAIVWLLNVKGTFSIHDLQHAVSTSTQDHRFDPSGLISIEIILSSCHGLVFVDEKSGQVRLIHYTAYEILPQHIATEIPDPHELIAMTCIAKLLDLNLHRCNLKTVSDYRKRCAQNPLLNYSAKHLFHHSRRSTSPGLNAALKSFARQCTSFPYTDTGYGEEVDIPLYILNTPLHHLGTLHVAALLDRPQLVLDIVRETQDPDVRSVRPAAGYEVSGGLTPLMLAAIEGCTQSAQALLPLDDWRQKKPSWKRLRTKKVKSLQADPNLVSEGATALMMATERGRAPIIEILLRVPGIDVNLVDGAGSSALMEAVSGGYGPIVEMLLRVPGIEANLVDGLGWSALMSAAIEGHAPIVEMLLRVPGIDANLVDEEGWSALMKAAIGGYTPIVEMLLRVPGIDANLVDEEGWSALMKAAIGGHAPIVEMLLRVPGIDANLVDEEGRSALMKAADRGHAPIIEMLLRVPGIEANLVDRKGESALMKATSGAHTPIVEMLLQLPGIDANLVDGEGQSALMEALYGGCAPIVEMLLQVPGIDANLVDGEGWSALMWAAKEGLAPIVEMLLRVPGIDVNLDGAGWSALMGAARGGYAPIVEMLLRVPGIDANLVDGLGWSALMMASDLGHEEAVAALLSYPGIDITIATPRGSTAEDIARRNGHSKIVQLLERAAKSKPSSSSRSTCSS